MIKRIVDISEPAYIHLQHQQLILEKNAVVVAQIPVEDLGILILQHPAIVITQALIIACQKNNVAIIFSDTQHLPYSVLLPLTQGHTLHSRIIQQQTKVTLPVKKRIWQQIVRFKIAQQALVLKRLNKHSSGLEHMVAKVRSGDCDNIEAQAAQKYWRLLFGDNFRRDIDAEGINSVLNYGYSIVRAMIARAIVVSGLHPSLGLQHSNQYNGLCLADDLMEPFRPWVDYLVFEMNTKQDSLSVNQITKQPLLNLLSVTVNWQHQAMPLMVACHYLLADIKRALTTKDMQIEYPCWPILGI